jgi:hypothetical protein
LLFSIHKIVLGKMTSNSTGVYGDVTNYNGESSESQAVGYGDITNRRCTVTECEPNSNVIPLEITSEWWFS